MKTVIALTGMPGSGKSTAGDILNKRGIRLVRMGDAVRLEMESKGLEINNFTLRNYALEIRQKHGPDYVLNLVKKEIEKAFKTEDTIVLDGVRNMVEITELKKESYATKIIGIVTDRKLRYERMIERNNSSDIRSAKDFEWREIQEFKFGVPEVLASADHYVLNNSSMAYFEEGLLEVFYRSLIIKQ